MAPPPKKKESKGDKSLSDILAEFDVTDPSNYEFDEDELKAEIAGLQTSSSARSPEEIDRTNNTKHETAIKAIQFASLSTEKTVLSTNEVKDSDKKTDGITKKMVQNAVKASVVFAFVHGNVTNKKAWFKIGDDEKDRKMFASLPLLNSPGSRSVLVHVYRQEIQKFLKAGHKNTLVTILEKSEVKLNKDRVQYLFPKGHLLLKDKKDIDAAREDLNSIFSEMAKPVDKRDFKLKWYGA